MVESCSLREEFLERERIDWDVLGVTLMGMCILGV